MNLEITCVANLKNGHKFGNIDHNDIVVSMCLDLISMHICVTYEGSVINFTGKRGNYTEKGNGCYLKNIGHIEFIFHAGAHVQVM